MDFLKSDLEQRRADKLYRFRRIAEQAQQSELVIDGHKLCCFCSNDYLSLANDAMVKEAFIKGAQHWGVGSGAAHLINGHTRAHHELEEELAEFTGRERALLYSTGYMANLGIVQSLLDRNDAVFEDRLNHASLIDAGLLSGAKLRRYAHLDSASLERLLQTRHEGEKLIASDGVFSMDGDIAPLQNLAKLSKQHKAHLMVDDAHGLGVLGPHGGGSLSLAELDQEDVPILVGTFGKAFGTFGAFVSGSETLIESLIQKSRTYIYTTAIPSAIAEATRCSLSIIKKESWRREKLYHNLQRFKQGAKQLAIPLNPSDTPIQPILVQSSENALELSEKLFNKGILLTAIRPPTVPEGTARLRVTFSSNHTEAQIDKLLDGLADVFSQQAKSWDVLHIFRT